MGNTDRAWKKLGVIDPYFSVLAHPHFRAAAAEGEIRREFFMSGEKHVEGVFAIIRESLDPEFAPRRALDFGCGVGRVTIPLARRVAQVVGVDVSDSMLDEANKNCEEAGMRVASPDGRDCYVDLARSFLPSTTLSILQRAVPSDTPTRR